MTGVGFFSGIALAAAACMLADEQYGFAVALFSAVVIVVLGKVFGG